MKTHAGHSCRGHQDGAGLKAISDLLEAKGIPEDWESTGRGLVKGGRVFWKQCISKGGRKWSLFGGWDYEMKVEDE